ncbi:peptide deformylase [Candidatus Saccharibacteria bacterium CG10_big_fil_rev_8_21_14_0_10_47_8]|nr:MAG: peptide deformylase [Candidatus Saccharibacteria bacterium CG10_big_fil_rev_8_21_14_0_10_47_8]
MKKSPIQPALDNASWLGSNLPIRFFGDPVLRTVCKPVTNKEIKNGSAKKWIDELTDFLKKYRTKTGAGRGLAANQIGISKRMILLWQSDGPSIYINPTVVRSTGEGVYPESCISSAALFIGEVKRPWAITVEYMTLDGEKKTLKADPIHTRLLLHELDHLDGIVCADRYTPGTIRMTTGDADEILKPELVRIK